MPASSVFIKLLTVPRERVIEVYHDFVITDFSSSVGKTVSKVIFVFVNTLNLDTAVGHISHKIHIVTSLIAKKKHGHLLGQALYQLFFAFYALYVHFVAELLFLGLIKSDITPV
jgi:hypothetical protein